MHDAPSAVHGWTHRRLNGKTKDFRQSGVPKRIGTVTTIIEDGASGGARMGKSVTLDAPSTVCQWQEADSIPQPYLRTHERTAS